MILLLFVSFNSCKSSTGTDKAPPNSFQALINGVPLSFIVDVAVIPKDGSASIGGTYCVASRFPRNMHIAISLPKFDKGNYNIPKEPYAGEPSVFIADSDGDGITGTYRPTTDESTTLVVENYNPKTGRLWGILNGKFEIEQSAGEEFRYFPDTIYVDKGIIDITLIPIDDFEPIWEYPCAIAL
tara:strand:+ start:22292 stop:22843 length:552 start_codon:yes stop_codon:yes gene_type:complete